MMYIEECLTPSIPSDVVPSVKLSKLRKFYDSSISRLVGIQSKVNTTHLKDKILDLDSNLQAVQDKNVPNFSGNLYLLLIH